MARTKHLAAGLLLGLITSWIIVGGYVLGVGYALDHVGRSCGMTHHRTLDLTNTVALIGLAVSGTLTVAFMLESWKNEGVPEVGRWGSHMRIIFLWVVVANGVLLLLLVGWLGCNAWSLVR